MNNAIAQAFRLSHCSASPRHTNSAECKGVVTVTATELCLACPLCGNERLAHHEIIASIYDPCSDELKRLVLEKIQTEGLKKHGHNQH